MCLCPRRLVYTYKIPLWYTTLSENMYDVRISACVFLWYTGILNEHVLLRGVNQLLWQEPSQSYIGFNICFITYANTLFLPVYLHVYVYSWQMPSSTNPHSTKRHPARNPTSDSSQSRLPDKLPTPTLRPNTLSPHLTTGGGFARITTLTYYFTYF